MLRGLASALLAGVALASAATPPDLATTFERRLAQLDVPTGSVSALVRHLDTGTTLWSLNPATPRNPASVMKIVTAFAALDRLGPGHRWMHRAYAVTAPDGDGRIDDLYLYGEGNPFWVAGEFDEFVSDLHRVGVRDIAGDLVLDRSYYAQWDGDRSAFDGKGYRVYNVLPHPLAMNFNSLRLVLVPNAARRSLAVEVAPPVSNLIVDNRIDLQRKPCSKRHMALKMRVDDHADEATKVTLEGRFPSRCQSFELTRSLLSHEAQLLGAFTARWTQLGAHFDGGWRGGTVPDDAVLLHEQPSRPLGDLLRFTNKFSNNVMARQIFLTLGAQAYGPPATLDTARAALRQTLADNGLRFDELVIDNGAGLSREARISAASLMALLEHAWRHRYAMDFFSSLPVPGVDGTLESRFEKGVFVGRAYVKTGTLDDVSAMAGLVTRPDGERFLVALLINHRNVHRGAGRSLQKALLRELIENGGGCCHASD